MSGSESLLDLGPDMVKEIAGIFDAAEALGNDEERLKAYHSVKAIISWMKVPLEDPDYRN